MKTKRKGRKEIKVPFFKFISKDQMEMSTARVLTLPGGGVYVSYKNIGFYYCCMDLIR